MPSLIPLCFLLQIHCLNSMPSLSPRPAKRLCIDWSNASPSDLENYCNMVSMNLPAFPSEVSRCVSTACSCHYNVLDTYAEHIVILCMIVLFTVFPLIPLLLEGWLGGRMVLGCLRRHLTFGIRCGLRLGALRLVCYLVLKRMLNGGTNMLIVVLSADSSICYRRNWLAPFPRKLKIISGLT